jgi:hypothetical protein
MEVEMSGQIWQGISRPLFLLSLTEVSHAVWPGAPMDMYGGTKAGFSTNSPESINALDGIPPAPQIEGKENKFLWFLDFIQQCKVFCLWGLFSIQGIDKMAGAKSQKGTWLKYTIQPIFRGCVMTFHPYNESHILLSLKLYEDLTPYLVFIMHYTLHKLRSFVFPANFTKCCVRL